MSLIYVCTDYDLSGPSVRERARIGLLLSCLYERIEQWQEILPHTYNEEDANDIMRELLFVQSEFEEVCKLLPDKTMDEIIEELEEQRGELLG